MRKPRSSTLIALAAAVAVAPPAVAQAPVDRPATHVVKKGDTLWDLAQQYLGDPFQWPQIYQLNTAKIKDPHWIYPGQEFALPGGVAAQAAAPADATPAAGAPARSAASSMTVFNPALRRTENRTRESLLMEASRTAVRAGDYETAPFMWSVGGPEGAGSIDGTAEPVGTAISTHRPMGIRELVVVTMPRGVAPAEGAQLLVYRLDDVVPNQGQVVIPTGVVQVVSAIDATHARAYVLRKFEDVFAGQRVIEHAPLDMPSGVYPSYVAFGMSTRIAWVYMKPMLPSSGHTMILAVGAGAGLATGDQLSIRTPPGTDPDGPSGDRELGVVQVTRVTPWGASAVILEVRDGGIVAGLRAQVSAKMP